MRITDVAEPEDANDAATKQYVDDTAKEDKLYTNAVIKTVSSEITSDISALQDDTILQCTDDHLLFSRRD